MNWKIVTKHQKQFGGLLGKHWKPSWPRVILLWYLCCCLVSYHDAYKFSDFSRNDTLKHHNPNKIEWFSLVMVKCWGPRPWLAHTLKSKQPKIQRASMEKIQSKGNMYKCRTQEKKNNQCLNKIYVTWTRVWVSGTGACPSVGFILFSKKIYYFEYLIIQ